MLLDSLQIFLNNQANYFRLVSIEAAAKEDNLFLKETYSIIQNLFKPDLE